MRFGERATRCRSIRLPQEAEKWGALKRAPAVAGKTGKNGSYGQAAQKKHQKRESVIYM